jgi:hypothetical protein
MDLRTEKQSSQIMDFFLQWTELNMQVSYETKARHAYEQGAKGRGRAVT